MVLLRIWALPPSILALLASFASSQQLANPDNLPRDLKYFPEHVAIARRELDIQQRLLTEKPVGIRKMSGDAGEKFLLDYWIFEKDLKLWGNDTLLSTFTHSFPLHSDKNTSSILPRFLDLQRLSLFQKRDYQCPSGTKACTGIARPNSCCATGSTCQIIEDTGLGDVGCCPAEQTCGGSVSECGDGYTACPNDPGGGCCVPGYGCFDVGCVQTSIQVIAPSSPPRASTTTVTSLVTVTASGGGVRTLTTTVIVNPAPPPTTTAIVPTTSRSSSAIITSTSRTTTLQSSSPSPSTACPTDFRSCPASLGGGCCHTDRACGSGRECPALSTSASFGPPQRPTDDVTTTTFSSISGVGCPTGFYACSAYYEGGCCQIDRDCEKTSCPALASTTLVSNSPTIVAPTGSGITAPGSILTGACAGGWSTCPPAEGGGCCPNGYTCGPTQCSAAGPAGQTEVAGKIAPNSGPVTRGLDKVVVLLALALSSSVLGLGLLL